MPWNTSYLPELGAVMTIYSGVIPIESLTEAVKETLALAKEHDTHRFLADCSALKGGHSIVDLYYLAKLLEEADIKRGLREALVLPQLSATADDVRFWETTCQNRGFKVRVFNSMDSARVWLVGNEE